MSGVVQQVLARVGSARLLLNSRTNDRQHALLSKTQCGAIVSLVESYEFRSTATAEQSATLAVRCAEVAWADGDLDKVLDALNNKTTVAAEPGSSSKGDKRRAKQELLAITEYFTPTEWRDLLDPEMPMPAKKEIMLGRAEMLGLTCPSEHTEKWFTSMRIFVSSRDRTDILKTPLQTKKLLLDQIKKDFEKIRRKLHLPTHIQLLPATPAAFKAAYPRMFESAYGTAEDDQPCACKVDHRVLLDFDGTWNCRNNVDKRPLQLGTLHGNSGEQFGCIAQMFMGYMQQQQMMLAHMMGKQGGMAVMANGVGGGSGQQSRPPRCLRALADLSEPRRAQREPLA